MKKRHRQHHQNNPPRKHTGIGSKSCPKTQLRRICGKMEGTWLWGRGWNRRISFGVQSAKYARSKGDLIVTKSTVPILRRFAQGLCTRSMHRACVACLRTPAMTVSWFAPFLSWPLMRIRGTNSFSARAKKPWGYRLLLCAGLFLATFVAIQLPLDDAHPLTQVTLQLVSPTCFMKPPRPVLLLCGP